MTADDLIERHARTGPICAAECRRALFSVAPRYQLAVSRVPRVVAGSGPILSIVSPCFGQTEVECARTSSTYRKFASRLDAGDTAYGAPMDTALDPKPTDSRHVLSARADKELAHAYEQITRADEQIAHAEQQLSKLERDAVAGNRSW